nr:adenylate/guanylate cyclase domain-containing protein [Halorhodospira halochloris]
MGANQWGLVAPLERIAYDQRTQWLRDDTEAPDEVVLLLIDESSLAALDPLVGRWPWPRSVWADLLDFLMLAEPSAVAFDILFTEDEIADQGQGDRDFAQAAGGLGRVVQAAQFLEPRPLDVSSADKSVPLPESFPEKFAVSGVSHVPGPQHHEHGLPLPVLQQSAAGIGIVTAIPDPDGVHRRLRPLHRYSDHAFPGLSLAALLVSDYTSEDISYSDGNLYWQDSQLALDDEGYALINPYAEFDAISLGAVFASLQRIRRGELEDLPVDPEELQGRLVFVGASAVGLHDIKATPLSSRTPGVELHASLAGNLINDETLRPAPQLMNQLVLLGAALAAGLAALLIPALWVRFGIPLLLIAGWSGWVYWQHGSGVVWQWAPVIVAILGAWLTTLVFLAFTEGRDRRKVRRLLAQYVSPAVLQEVVDQRGGVATGEVGSSEEVTLLFSDVRGFTALSEQHSAAHVVELLNIHLEVMSEEIFAYEGTLDKFIGDAIMAFWGAPIRVSDHAERAVRTALAMERRMEEVNERIHAALAMDSPLRIGIGLHTGEVVLGNIGSARKLDYTVIGDNVNVASRMEGLTKPYGCTVLISGETRTAIGEGFICMFVDRLRVKGRQKPLDVYRPLALPEDDEQTRSRALEYSQITQKAYNYYRSRDWQAALETINELPASDPVRCILAERYAQYSKNPPPQDWDGAYTMESK